jgi:hypothetical protein
LSESRGDEIEVTHLKTEAPAEGANRPGTAASTAAGDAAGTDALQQAERDERSKEPASTHIVEPVRNVSAPANQVDAAAVVVGEPGDYRDADPVLSR